MRTPIIAYLTSLIVMGIMDGGWLGFATSRLYRPGIGHLMTDKPVIWAAALFYLLYAAGVTYLITLPALAGGGFGAAVTRGAVFGLIAYGTYDLTSLAILQGWPLNVTVLDMIWGAIITAVTAGVALLVTRKFG
ncbi:MAG TPA: DUF2177 family protein [Acidocella sp.]|jgi:uncharacterized membrane protein|nr:MAG: hypothetical protein B7Z77_07950 [Acidocella sp. 20-58-15]OYY03426.1 MAG: hypothetical protein B7Y73_06810 [Acidocella sp. 35-58-6]HQT39773.1 DUF2177 family protein [Acidocella sp.]